MMYRPGRKTLNNCLLGVGLLTLGGCLPLVPLPDELTTLPEPGTYYVERHAGQLYYYQLAEVRGENDQWVALSADGAWYAGPGFYRLSEELTWSADESAEGLTLDDFIQLHDPPPAPPDVP